VTTMNTNNDRVPFTPADATAIGDFVDNEPTAPSASSSPLRDITPAPRSGAAEPERDASGDPRPYLNGEALLSALKYALVACPKPSEDDSLLSYVVFARDETRGRISFTACDTNRWHQSFVACEKGIDLHGTFRLPKADVQRLKDFLQTAVDRGSICNVRPKSDSIGVCSWEIAFGETHPIVIDVSSSFAHEGWQPPQFAVGAGAAAAAMHDARHVAKALTVQGAESTRVVRDEVDSEGRRFVTIADEFGHELARAVLVQLGFTEGEPESAQKEIPGALGTEGRARSSAPKASKKGAKASKPAKTAAKKGAGKKGKRR